MNDKVYIVTAGEYSDYRIVAVFDSEEKAKDYIDHDDRSDFNDIEEWALNSESPNRGEKLYALTSNFYNVNFEVDNIYNKRYRPEIRDAVQYGGKGRVCMLVLTTSKTRAKKIAYERLAQIKAEEEIKYPFLRRPCIFENENGRCLTEYPAYHYPSGDILLRPGYKLIEYRHPMSQEVLVKTRVMESEK